MVDALALATKGVKSFHMSVGIPARSIRGEAERDRRRRL
jgi:hypothetical protein